MLSKGDGIPYGKRRQKQLAEARQKAFESIKEKINPSSKNDVMADLLSQVAALQVSNEHKIASIELIGAIPVLLAWIQHRFYHNKTPAPDPKLSHSQDFLRMMGLNHSKDYGKALEKYWLTIADQGMNASTFTARVVASTGSDLVSGITAALGSLKGPLHGGAPGPVLDMLDAIGQKDNALPWLSKKLENRERIMGMGHRVYKVRDPRATILQEVATSLRQNSSSGRLLELASHVEQTAEKLLKKKKPDLQLKANVEFYTAILLNELGFSREFFTGVFAAGRVIGWCAHFQEQQLTGRLIRPKARYRPNSQTAESR